MSLAELGPLGEWSCTVCLAQLVSTFRSLTLSCLLYKVYLWVHRALLCAALSWPLMLCWPHLSGRSLHVCTLWKQAYLSACFLLLLLSHIAVH